VRNHALKVGFILLVTGLIIIGFALISRSGLEGLIKAEGWEVEWYYINEYGVFGDMIGTTSYPVKFRFESVSFKGVDEMFDFKASMTINLLKDLTVRFEAGGRHHIILKVDGKTIIDFWGAANKYSDAENVPLEAGIHRLELEYYVFHKAGGRTPWFYST